MIVFPNAKINLGLNVIKRRADGYHDIETILIPIPLNDALEMAESSQSKITVTGLTVDGDPEENLVMKAYRLLKADFNLPEVSFHLHKMIPSGAGLGGGSSDGAFTLKLLNDYFQLNLSIEELGKYALQLGADTPFFLLNRPALGEGIGEILSPIEVDLSSFYLLIIDPDIFVNTGEAYRQIFPRKPITPLKLAITQPIEKWRELISNDFEKVVFKIYPEVGELKSKLYQKGAVYVSMTGSGSALFAIFRDRPRNLGVTISERVIFSGCISRMIRT